MLRVNFRRVLCFRCNHSQDCEAGNEGVQFPVAGYSTQPIALGVGRCNAGALRARPPVRSGQGGAPVGSVAWCRRMTCSQLGRYWYSVSKSMNLPDNSPHGASPAAVRSEEVGVKSQHLKFNLRATKRWFQRNRAMSRLRLLTSSLWKIE